MYNSSVRNTVEEFSVSVCLLFLLRFLGSRRRMLRSVGWASVYRMNGVSCLVLLPAVWRLLPVHSPPKLSDMPSPACGRPSSAGWIPQSTEVFRDGKLRGQAHATHPDHFFSRLLPFFFSSPLPPPPTNLDSSFSLSLSEFGGRISDFSPSLPSKCSM